MRQPRSDQEDKKQGGDYASLEEAIRLTGFGRFHYGLIATCGACFLSAAFQNGLNAYVLPLAQRDLQLSSSQKGVVNAAFLVGSICSSYLWGTLADTIGRKYVIVACLLIDSLISIASSMSQTYMVFTAFRFFSGFVVGGPASLVFPYLGEFHSIKHSARSICYVGFFWTLSWIFLPALAWVVIPQPWTLETSSGFTYNSWRIFVALFCLPSLLGAVLVLLYPESPKFLAASGNTDAALAVLRQMFETNMRKPASLYSVKLLEGPSRPLGPTFTKGGACKSLGRLTRVIWLQTRELFIPPVLWRNLLCCCITFSNMFGYYGLGLWLPELLNRFETHYKLHPNTTVSVCELATANQNITDDCCQGNGVDDKVFLNTAIVGATCLVGNLLSGALAGRVGRRTMPVATMLLAGMCSSSIYFLRSAAQNLIIMCLFLCAIGTANFVITSIIVDIFPTHIRAMAVCLAILCGRLGAVVSNLVFGLLLDISCEVPLFLVGAVVIAGAMLCLLIPNPEDESTTKKEIKTVISSYGLIFSTPLKVPVPLQPSPP